MIHRSLHNIIKDEPLPPTPGKDQKYVDETKQKKKN